MFFLVKPALAVVSVASVVASCCAVPSLLKTPENPEQKELVNPEHKARNARLENLVNQLEEARRRKDDVKFKDELQKYYRGRFCHLDPNTNTYDGCSRHNDFVYEDYYKEHIEWLERETKTVRWEN